MRGDDFESDAAGAGVLFEAALGAEARAGDEHDLVAVIAGEVLAVEDCVFLRAAEDQSSDDVGDAHWEERVRGRRSGVRGKAL